LLRYFTIASVIVLGAAVLAANWWTRQPHARLRIARVAATPISATGYANNGRMRAGAPFIGDAPWALSALPECLLQKAEASGPPAFVRAALPKGAQPIAAPATLQYRDCTIQIRADDALVTRGADRLHIPPDAHFYRLGNRLLLLYEDASGAQLRTYAPSNF
jgi:hypothetical protein